MYCRYCGREIDYGMKFCPGCGMEIKGKNYDNINDEFKEKEKNKGDKPYKTFLELGYALGIASLCLFFIPPLAFTLAAPGIVLSVLGRRYTNEDGIKYRKGLFLSIAGSIISLILLVALFIAYIIFIISISMS